MARLPGSATRLWNRQPVARDRIWQSMRVLRRFTQPELMATAEASKDNVKYYVRGLLRAGYVKLVSPAVPQNKVAAVYQLVRDTGHRAPRLQSNGRTYDPNEHNTRAGGIRQRQGQETNTRD